MKLRRRQFLHLAAGAAAFPAMSRIARAQAYPTRPITMIVPFAAAGPTDVSARIVSEHMSRTLGQPIIIENIAGAGGTIGSTRAMRANPNGYTIEMGQMGTHAAAVALYPNLAYKPDIDFAPIGLVNWVPHMIVARKDFPPKDLNEFISHVRANAKKLNQAHAGVGSIGFTCGLLFNSILGVKPTSVPFNGFAPAINALIGGQVDYMCAGVGTSVPYVLSGAIKAYVIGAEQRSSILPNVPTSNEAGLPEFQAEGWAALFAPKGTAKPILDKLGDALDKALDDDNSRKRLLDLGNEIPDKASRGQQPLAALVKSEIARWTPIIEAANIKALPVVGYLGTRTLDSDQYLVAAFQQGLNDAGLVEGRNVAFEYRWARNDYNRLPELAADLVRREVAVIVTLADERATAAAKAASSTIPIFFHTAMDPVEIGLIAGFNRPSGNVTGVTSMNTGLAAKRLGLLRELMPAATRFAVLVNPSTPGLESSNRGLQASASAMGRQIDVVFARTDREIDTAFATLVQNRVDALLVGSDPLFASRSEQLVALAARHAVPAIYAFRDHAEKGGLISYGPSIPDLARQSGIYIGRILRGEKPADLPVMRSTKFELVINLKTAKALGVAVPLTLLVQADEVIK